MRRCHCWKTCLLALLVLHHADSGSSPSLDAEEGDRSGSSVDDLPHNSGDASRDEDGLDKAVGKQLDDDQKQLQDTRQGKRNWKRWVRRLLIQEHINNFVLLDGLLSHAWRNHGRRKTMANVLIYLENDDRRARTFALEPARDEAVGSTMMAPLEHKQGDDKNELYAGMILRVDYGLTPGEEGVFNNQFQEQLQIPICRDIETASAALFAIDTYQLLEPLHLELGLAEKHAIDFAYTPVEFSSGAKRQQYHHEHFSPTALVHERGHLNSGSSWWHWWFPFGGGNRNSFWKGPDAQYKMSETAFAGGSHGEVWRGRRLCREDHSSAGWGMGHTGSSSTFGSPTCKAGNTLIFKRLKVEMGYRILEAGLREVYLGKLLAEDRTAGGLFTTYVNHFFREVPKKSTTKKPWSEGENDLELWIVFEDAGPSIRSYLYSPVSMGDFVVFQHSYLWTKLRQNAAGNWQSSVGNDTSVSTLFDDHLEAEEVRKESKAKTGNNSTISGKVVIKEILRQVLTAAAFLHEQGIVHRDIKPSNCMCKTNLDLDKLQVGDYYGAEELEIDCRLGDFSSVWDRYTEDNLYTNGPSIEELTIEYAPPEALLGSPWDSFSEEKPQSYDSWSIGVLALELLLGTPNVFSVDQRTTALLTNKMQKKGASEKEIRRALYLAALSQFCIYMPAGSKKQKLSWPLREGDPLYKIAMVKESCTLRDFHQALRARDPLGLGFDSSTDQLLHLIWQLLAWDPLERMTAAEALDHPYFHNSTTSGLEPGDHNALESQMLDPRMDFNLSDNVDEFVCPKCGRVFSDWKSCHQHANARRHAKFCTYDRSKLPSSVNAHSMLPAHPKSGYFDIQGRRPTIEDFHSIQLLPSKEFFGVFDGHTGNLASKFAASTLYEQLTNRLSNLDDEIRNGTVGWKENVKGNLTEAFANIHQQFLKAVSFQFAGHGAMDDSGTTATAVYVTDEAIVVASLGDSRAVLSSASKVPDSDSDATKPDSTTTRRQRNGGTIGPFEMSAIQLTKDHVASDAAEAEFVRQAGGEISVVQGLARVNGRLAITRSIGDAPFASVLSRVPHVITMTKKEVRDMCGVGVGESDKQQQGRDETTPPCFIVLASDGLWDMVSNQEAVDLVAQTIASYESNSTKHDGGAFQEASEALTLEAYVRGSTDNIGVCVISLN